MDNSYQIITDATADLTPELLAGFDLKVIPMPVTLDGKTFHHYNDFREMPAKDFYDAVRAGKDASTAQINLLTYLRAFIPTLRAGKDLVYFCFSSGLSGTIQSANIVLAELREKFPERKILCIDTVCASLGQGFLLYHALLRQREGMSLDELVAWAERDKRRASHWFTVEDLNHLHKGGRLSKTAAVAGTMLQIKPILTVDAAGGLKVANKARGTAKAYQFIVNHMKETAVHPAEQTVFIGHTDNPEGAEKLKSMVEGLVRQVVIQPIGPVIGAHTGAGMVALVYWGGER